MPINPRLAVSRAGVRAAVAAWLRFEATLKPSMQGLLVVVRPWRRLRSPWLEPLHVQAQRRLAVHQLGELCRRHSADLMRTVLDEGLTAREWAERLAPVAQNSTVAGALVGVGGTTLRDAPTQRRVAGVLETTQAKLDSLVERVEAEDISAAQAAAWAGQAVRGSVRSAQMIGGVSWYSDQPIQRIMGAGEKHCGTCPGKAGSYDNLEHYLAVCGGWPGDGSDDCHGNCYCSLEPVAATSRGTPLLASDGWESTPITAEELAYSRSRDPYA